MSRAWADDSNDVSHLSISNLLRHFKVMGGWAMWFLFGFAKSLLTAYLLINKLIFQFLGVNHTNLILFWRGGNERWVQIVQGHCLDVYEMRTDV